MNELLEEDGIIVAAEVFGNTVKRLDKSFFGGAEKWISDWEVMFGSELHVMVSGSPKLDLYETDFGWGRPKKIEEISIDTTRAISLTESRDLEGGIEVGLALPKPEMDAFVTLYTEESSSEFNTNTKKTKFITYHCIFKPKKELKPKLQGHADKAN
ncbi:malonyl-coenzyme:anthocyanin 5-o-glucoside-6'''-o-malonyltransferase [Quercus suber]|uniref:Malonyl-coenzyme:anthocyanin 5-o-glucoside-6'''-o-malonyltransferase n=1 Tax=Quercus suber TaxID=58331 RepID=A0AAW0M9R0_QUESU